MLARRPDINPLQVRTPEGDPAMGSGIYEFAREIGTAVLGKLIAVCHYVDEAIQSE